MQDQGDSAEKALEIKDKQQKEKESKTSADDDEGRVGTPYYLSPELWKG